MPDLTAERAKKLLDYNPETGTFTRLVACRGYRSGEIAGCLSSSGYILLGIDRRIYPAHRIAWLIANDKLPNHIDHINGDKSDNRLANLRDATRFVNTQNLRVAKKNNKSGLLGVSMTKGKKFRANIRCGGKQIHLGTFATSEEAHAAYVSAKRQLHAGCTI